MNQLNENIIFSNLVHNYLVSHKEASTTYNRNSNSFIYQFNDINNNQVILTDIITDDKISYIEINQVNVPNIIFKDEYILTHLDVV